MIEMQDDAVVYLPWEWDYRMKAKLYAAAYREGRTISISEVDGWALIVWPRRVSYLQIQKMQSEVRWRISELGIRPKRA